MLPPTHVTCKSVVPSCFNLMQKDYTAFKTSDSIRSRLSFDPLKTRTGAINSA